MTGKWMAVGALLASLLSAAGLGSAPAQALNSGVTLQVNPAGDGVQLATDTFDDADGLPSYTMTLSDVSAGASVPLGYGSTKTYYSNSGDYDTYDTYYTNFSTGAVVPGHTYEVYLAISTVGYEDCSIYYSDGCHWIKPTAETFRWRFNYTGASVTATSFTAPSAFDLGLKRPARTQGWKITGVLRVEGAPLPNAVVKGQAKVAGGRWRGDSTFETDAEGQIHVKFRGEARPTKYRFFYAGSSTVAGSYSNSFSITHRH